MRALASFVCVLAPTGVRATGIEGFKHNSWTSEQGAPGNVVGLTQTPDGYLWLASAEGVFRFDGLSFEHIAPPPDPRFASAIPTAVFADRQGRLWVGFNQAAGAAIYRDGALHAVPMTKAPPSLLKFAQRRDGAVWASWGGGGDRLFRYAQGRWQVMDRALRLPAGEIASLAVTPDDSLWVSLGRSREAGMLARLSPGAARFQIAPDQVGFTMLARAPDGGLWVSDQYATRQVRDAGGRLPEVPSRFAPVSGAAVPTLAFDRRGGIWGTTRGVGLFRAVRHAGTANVQRLGEGRLLSSDATIETFTDREGSIWVATDAGLDRYRPAPVARLSSVPPDVQDGLKLARAPGGAVFVASAHQLFQTRPEGARRIGSGLGRVGALCSASTGVWAVHGGRITRHGHGSASLPLPPDSVTPTACVEDRAGRLWLNGADAVWLRDAGKWRRHPANLDGSALDLVRDPTGEGILVNTGRDALLRLTPAGSQRVGASQLGLGTLTALWTVGDAAFVSGATGVARVTATGIRRLSSVRNPWLVGVRGMALDRRGDAWFLVRLGIARVSARELARGFATPHATLRHRLFGAPDGYDTRGQAVSFRGAQVASSADGRIFFATRAGTLMVDPALIARNLVPPPVTIRMVTAGEQSRRDPPAMLRLREGLHDIRIAFAVNSLAVPSRNRTFFRLEGQDSGWTAAGLRREASYTNLKPGRYLFRVIAANPDGVWNRTGASLAIEVPPTFVERWPFRLLCAAAAAVLLWLAYRIRLRFVARRIRSRLLDRLRERERVARDIHDTLLQSIQALMLRFQLASDALPPDHAARRDLEAAMDRADEVVAEGRDRLRDLRRSDGLEDPEAALREIAGRQLVGSAVAATIRSSGTRRPLDAGAWDELASIAAEVLFNVARHAHASEVLVELDYRGSGLTLRVEDDGVGIPADVARDGRRGHFGIPGMRERAGRIGGTFRIGARREGGTSVIVTAPAAMIYRGGGGTR
ncbi:sensor histidine kinase [Sphingomonas jatrophae]|uniref:Histidine kinase-, DNA gyrase B-, and HSP90-like ATPase n=1 Tax=Sphingomonas jatrophae TaxID=1166337 RepID=A0A1I6KZF8_9SPHN|nr:sensor histidine kinase [Sphingomonas jatrophae]SFR96623.1 Histidine kinase-, DNA gyrase B-, and HSP90-like ATPase [Sphingomonas jatrophae]